MDIIVVTTAKSDVEARSLLKNLGLPFRPERTESPRATK